jgi:hypothetical protein
VEATDKAVAAALSTIGADLEPTITSARTASPESAAIAVAAATAEAPFVSMILTTVPSDRSPVQMPARYDPDLMGYYYATMVLGIPFELAGMTRVAFPSDVRRELDEALLWSSEGYDALLPDGRFLLGIGYDDRVDTVRDAINVASLGAVILETGAPFPRDAEHAEALLSRTYPLLAADYLLVEEEGDQYRYESRAMLPIVAREEPTLSPQLVYAGVSQASEGGAARVWVVVARGLMVPILDEVLRTGDYP